MMSLVFVPQLIPQQYAHVNISHKKKLEDEI